MFKYIAENLVFLLIKHKRLDIANREIYNYGLEAILLNGLLLICFLPLRMFAGGYHSKRSETCFMLSNAMYLFSLGIVKKYLGLHNNINIIIVTFIALIIMYIWSPVKNQNRPLADYQYKRNKKITIVIIVIDFVLLLVLLKLNLNIASSATVFVLLNCSSFLLGILSNVFYKITNN